MTQTERKKKPPVYYTGLLLLVMGGAFLGAFLPRQIKEWDTGHNYFGFLAAGVTLAAVGSVFFVRHRRP